MEYLAAYNFKNNKKFNSLGENRDDDDGDDEFIYRYKNYRSHTVYMSECKIEGRTRSTRIIVKLFVIAIFCVFLYIPLYKRVNEQPFIDDHIIEGWFLNTNRGARSYVLPDNVTTIYEPQDICGIRDENKIFLLVIVCSATSNFKRRMTIRETWGDYEKYLKLVELFYATENKFKDYNQYDENNIFKDFGANFEKSNVINVTKIKNKSVSDENNISHGSETKENMQQQESKRQVRSNYNTKSNLRKVLSVNLKSQEESDITERILDFKLIFLLGLPSDEDVDVQYSIDDEVEKYGDVIQESFIDSYNNLTIKSIMMLKWITHKCNDSIRYIFKADDDSYINMRRLILNLRRRAQEFDDTAAQSHKKRTEYLLLGDLFLASKPIHNISDKWYSPRYMYRGNVYPRYLSGTGYVLSVPTAHSLYEAALRTNIFHLEDIYITGVCAERAVPRIRPRHDPQFGNQLPEECQYCCAYEHITVHQMSPFAMRVYHSQMFSLKVLETCEKKRQIDLIQNKARLFVMCKFVDKNNDECYNNT